MRAILILGTFMALAACGQPVTPPSTQIKLQDRIVEVQRPCRATAPVKPAPLARPLPDDQRRLAAVLAAKLEEYAGQGMFADRALDALAQCLR